MKRLFLILYILLFATPSFAATYYVDNSGCGDCADYRVVERDCGSGTEQNWDTIQEAADNVAGAGDIVNIRAGTYSESVDWDTNSGSDPDYITFQNYNSEVVTILGPNEGAPFVISSVTWVKIVGLIFDGQSGAGVIFSI